ncbi:hypothetical protein [Streptomyces sp. bgisy153]
MRIRSVLAAAAMAVALTAAGAATASAAQHDPRHCNDRDACDTYFGGIDTSSSDLFWGGAYCRDHH